MYRHIFNKTFREQGSKPWKRGIVKISHVNDDGENSIHRMFASGNSFCITNDLAGVDAENFSLLGVGTNDNATVEISKGSIFRFYWDHPEHHNRVAFKLSLVFGLISFVSLIVSVISIIITFW